MFLRFLLLCMILKTRSLAASPALGSSDKRSGPYMVHYSMARYNMVQSRPIIIWYSIVTPKVCKLMAFGAMCLMALSHYSTCVWGPGNVDCRIQRLLVQDTARLFESTPFNSEQLGLAPKVRCRTPAFGEPRMRVKISYKSPRALIVFISSLLNDHSAITLRSRVSTLHIAHVSFDVERPNHEIMFSMLRRHTLASTTVESKTLSF